ncbi:MAG: protein-L-isoaspartate(D-aspartate) O-methyltransferase [Deltaproteobacteria bacterium]|nr:protein-L-isoaspartate(D-aspartate) O-methyltransferase [Deltaproteobacteria bacterium]
MSGLSWKKTPGPPGPPKQDGNGDYAISRKRMVREQLIARGIRDERVLEAFLKVPRHLFVEEGLRPMAYNDHPLSIGQAQTISQPYIVAYMLEALHLTPQDKILEIGTGCGYQTAILAELTTQVYSIERISGLLLKARNILKRLHYKNIHLKLGDGTLGWPEKAPFDAIVVAAGSPQVPQPYFDQCSEAGRFILPVGNEFSQDLVLYRKVSGEWQRQTLSGCRFVKLKGKHGFEPT